MFTAACFTTANAWRSSKCPRWMDGKRKCEVDLYTCTHTHKGASFICKKETLASVVTWMDLTDHHIKGSKVRQKDMVSSQWNKKPNTQEESSGWWLPEAGGKGVKWVKVV